MEKPKLRFITNAEAEIPPEWEQYLWELFKPRVEALIEEKLANSVSGGRAVSEYMPMEWFLETFKNIGTRQTFSKIIGKRVHRYRQGKCKIYNVGQFKQALQLYKPVKPVFINSLKRVV